MFALFEADGSGVCLQPTPQVASLRSLPGANRVQPLRGCALLTWG